MNKHESKLNFKAFLALLAVLMLSVVLAVSTACGNKTEEPTDETDDSTTTEETEVDNQTIYNGDFEFNTTSTSSFPVSSSSIRWTRKTDSDAFSAPSSSVTSGIIDTKAEAYAELADTNKPYTEDGEGNKTYINPGTPGLAADEDTEVKEEGTKILMIHNKVNDADKQGTAQYFTSSATITLAPENAAKISVWVRTDNLVSRQSGNNYGAYIKIANTVSSAIEPLVIKNINTNGSWVNYVIYLKPSDTAVTRYNVILGLGMGDKVNKEELCEGFAFFDNVEYTVINPDDFDDMTTADAEIELYNGGTDYVLDKEDAANYNPSAFTVNEAGAAYTADTPRVVKMNFAKAADVYTGLAGSSNYGYNAVNPNSQSHDVNVYDAGYTATAKDSVIGTDESTKLEVPANSVYMNFQGQTIGSSYSYESPVMTLAAGSYARFSFMAKVSAKSSTTNASVVVREILDTADETKNYDSSTGKFDNFTTDKLTSEYHDDYIRYTFYIANNYDETMNYTVKFSFGPTKLTSGSDLMDLPVGYAIFTDFLTGELTEAEYKAANTSTDNHAVKFALLGDHVSDFIDNEEEDENKYEDIEEDYTFSVSSAVYPLLETEAVSLDDLVSSEYTALNVDDDTTVGIVNSYFASSYNLPSDVIEALNELKDLQKYGAKQKNVQPLLILNDAATAAGIRLNSVTVPAASTYTFSVKVRAIDNAKAYIYLINTDIDGATVTDGNVSYPVNVFNATGNTAGDDINLTMSATVSSETTQGDDGYVLVTFYVRSGNDALNLRLELWNGGRDNTSATASEGAVFFDFVNGGSYSAYEDFESLASNYSNGAETFTAYSYNPGERLSYVDKYDPENPEYALDGDGNRISTLVDTQVAAAVSKEGATVQFYRYDVLKEYNYDIVESETETEEEEEEPEDTTDDENGSNGGSNIGWLQITSILIAVALIIALVAAIVRKAFKNKKKKKEKTRSYYAGYNKNTRRTPPKGNAEIEKPDDTDSDYDYDNPENN